LYHAQEFPQVMDKSNEALGFNPAHALLVDGVPGRQVMGDEPLGCACAYHPAQSVEDFAQGMLALGCLFGHQGQIRDDKSPFGIRDVTGVSLAAGMLGSCHQSTQSA